MYEAYLQNSDVIRANIIAREDREGKLEGCHQDVNGTRVVYQVAQICYVKEQTELRTFPLTEKLVKKLGISEEELQGLAAANLKRLSILYKEAAMASLAARRRPHGRS